MKHTGKRCSEMEPETLAIAGMVLFVIGMLFGGAIILIANRSQPITPLIEDSEALGDATYFRKFDPRGSDITFEDPFLQSEVITFRRKEPPVLLVTDKSAGGPKQE